MTSEKNKVVSIIKHDNKKNKYYHEKWTESVFCDEF